MTREGYVSMKTGPDVEFARVVRVLDALDEEQEQLTEGELDLLETLTARATKYGADMFMSEKQWAWLLNIAKKLGVDTEEE